MCQERTRTHDLFFIVVQHLSHTSMHASFDLLQRLGNVRLQLRLGTSWRERGITGEATGN